MKSGEERGVNSTINGEPKGRSNHSSKYPSILPLFHLSNFRESFCKPKSFALRSLEENKLSYFSLFFSPHL